MNAPLHEIRLERLGDADVVRLSGEVDLSNVTALDDAVASTSAHDVALDLTELTYIDSAGIRAVDRCYRSLEDAGRALVVVVPSDSPAEWIFRVTGLSESLRARSLPEALASLRHGREQSES